LSLVSGEAKRRVVGRLSSWFRMVGGEAEHCAVSQRGGWFEDRLWVTKLSESKVSWCARQLTTLLQRIVGSGSRDGKAGLQPLKRTVSWLRFLVETAT
jgi:hypothetical protein